MDSFATDAVPRLVAQFEANRDPAKAIAMSAYMRGQFMFLGIPSPARRQLQREALAGLDAPNEQSLINALSGLWQRDEREYQYAAADLAARHIRVCGPASLDHFQRLITEKSWWDTVDALAVHAVGAMIARFPELVTSMDDWIDDDRLWIRRTAILHQLGRKATTDTERLFAYCLHRSHERDFFIRKAIGWALREYSKTDRDAVSEFVAAHEAELSPLSRREALLWITGRQKKGT